MPRLIYCSWGPYQRYFVARLDRVQSKFMRRVALIIFNIPHDDLVFVSVGDRFCDMDLRALGVLHRAGIIDHFFKSRRAISAVLFLLFLKRLPLVM